jgi:hypothetical protein
LTVFELKRLATSAIPDPLPKAAHFPGNVTTTTWMMGIGCPAANLKFRDEIWQPWSSCLLNGGTRHPAHIMLNPIAC